MDALVESLLRTSIDDAVGEPQRTPEGSDISEGEEENQTIGDSLTFQAPPQHGGHQTGPKGVLADHAFHQQMIRERQVASIASHNQHMQSKAFTTTSYREDELKKNSDEALLEEFENLSSDEEEKEALRKYREKRLKEINVGEFSKGDNPRFGSLKEISANQYVKAIDNEANNVAIVLHLYENFIPQCRRMNECLALLARKYVQVKFLRILARELEFDPVGLPAILVYKNGTLIANLVKITEQIGEADFDPDTVEQVLISNGALQSSEIFVALNSNYSKFSKSNYKNDGSK
ncbi:hypothetical protein G9A89_019552 [Geosiphon pyriformis]|nr:hypothetical protein G9A89_019552 [Geosiphon pyriformis]